MGTGLTFSYSYSSDPLDDFGWLEVAVVGDMFSGCGGFWVQSYDVKKFGEDLSAFPISPESPLTAAWGYEPWEGDSLVVSVEISPADRRGNLLVEVWLRDHTEMGEGKVKNCVRTSFTTNYPELQTFQREIAIMMERESDKAELVGH